jgi:hypothetical protein
MSLRATGGSEAISRFGKIRRLLRRFAPRNDTLSLFQHPVNQRCPVGNKNHGASRPGTDDSDCSRLKKRRSPGVKRRGASRLEKQLALLGETISDGLRLRNHLYSPTWHPPRTWSIWVLSGTGKRGFWVEWAITSGDFRRWVIKKKPTRSPLRSRGDDGPRRFLLMLGREECGFTALLRARSRPSPRRSPW